MCLGHQLTLRERSWLSKLSVEPGATFNATCSMENGVKELSIKEEIESSEKEKTAHNFIIYSQLALQMLIIIGGGVFRN